MKKGVASLSMQPYTHDPRLERKRFKHCAPIV